MAGELKERLRRKYVCDFRVKTQEKKSGGIPKAERGNFPHDTTPPMTSPHER